MKNVGHEAARDLLLLSLTAGSADATGYLGLGRVFTSNMTGNVVLLGIDLGQGHMAAAGRVLFVLSTFLSGLCLGAWLGRGLPEKQWTGVAFRLIGLEKIILLIFGIAWFLLAKEDHEGISYGLLALLSLAMGLQSAALYRLSAPGVVTTAITGTLTAFATGLMNLILDRESKSPQREAILMRVRFQLVIISLYACGAGVEGLFITHLPHLAGFLPVVAAVFVALRYPSDRPKIHSSDLN